MCDTTGSGCGTGGWLLAREFIWGRPLSSSNGPEPVAMVDHTGVGLSVSNTCGTGATTQPATACGSGTPTTPGCAYHYLRDVLGSVIGLTDCGGKVVERYTYDPYGRTLIEKFDGTTWTPTAASSFGNPFMWTGQRYDAGVKLYHFLFRSYSPVLGRWLQRDPLGYIDGVNLYEYVRGNSLFWLDPLGLAQIIIYISERNVNSPGGHAWVEIIFDSGFSETFGFYPQNGTDISASDFFSGKEYPGEIRDDSKRPSTDRFSFEVDEEDAKLASNVMHKWGKNPPNWSKRRNCSSFACTVARAAGIWIDDREVRTLGLEDPHALRVYLHVQQTCTAQHGPAAPGTHYAQDGKGNCVSIVHDKDKLDKSQRNNTAESCKN